MEPNTDQLLSALQDAEEFISVTLAKESLSVQAESQRRQLATRLHYLTKKATGEEQHSFPPPPPNLSSTDELVDDLYDDVREGDDGIKVKEGKTNGHPLSDKSYAVDIKGTESNESTDGPTENYDDVGYPSEKPQEETYDDTVIQEETYDDTVIQEENYEEPAKEEIGGDSVEDYKIAEMPSDPIEEDLYDGVEEISENSTIGIRDRSSTQQLEDLAKPVKASDIQDVIYKGYLDKQRKKGIYFGSRWQRRYCIVRSLVMYYFAGENSDKQKGTIFLPGYQVSHYKPNKSSKEFILTMENNRSYIFMANSKKELEEWIDAVRKGGSTRMSNRQSEVLDNLRNQPPDVDEDASSLGNDDVFNGKDQNSNEEAQETYDDVNDQAKAEEVTEEYEIPGSAEQNKPKSESELVMEELYDDLADEVPAMQTQHPTQPASIPDATTEELTYEMPEDTSQVSTPPLQPPRTAFTGQTARQEQVPPEPARPPRPSKGDIPPTSFEEEEFYDDVGVSDQPGIIEPEKLPATPPAAPRPPIPLRTGALPPPPQEIPRVPSPLLPRVIAQMPLPPPPKEPQQGTGKPNIPPRKTESSKQEPGMESQPIPSWEIPNDNSSQPPRKDAPEPPPEQGEEKQAIDYEKLYQALWDCRPDAEDELEFNRGDLIYIYEKPHSDWWIGSKFKPQGYETRLIPKNYLTEAYSL